MCDLGVILAKVLNEHLEKAKTKADVAAAILHHIHHQQFVRLREALGRVIKKT